MSIETDMNELLSVLSDASEGLFEITGVYAAHFENGVYRCAIAKPTKRMKAALSVDREILVVASNFADQQQRTVKLVRREIDQSAGRYEQTLAIVIHADKEGNSKLRNWGRDVGISILPVYGRGPRMTPQEFEASLNVELYSHDPYDLTGPVSDDANFFGRRDEAIDMARKLQRGQIRSCLGVRKVGKTSIINRVVRETEANYDALCLMIDCSRDDVWSLSAAQLVDTIHECIDRALQDGSKYASIRRTGNRTAGIGAAREALEVSVMSCGKPLILVFDEIDYITPGSPTNPEWRSEFNPLWRSLRTVYQECDRQGAIMSMLVGGVSTYWFTVESIDGVENAALAFVPEEYLSPLKEGATVAMLRRLGKTAGLFLDEDASVAIAQTTGNMPYWARKCGSYIHRRIPVAERPCRIERSRVEPLIRSFVEEEGASIAEVALRHLFRVHPRLEDTAEKCSSGRAAEAVEADKRALRRYGVLSSRDDLAGAMLSRAFESMMAGRSSAPRAPEASERSLILSLDEWAEEIASLGQRRNLLERRLRDIVLNFIRFDSLSSGTDPKERMLAAVGGKRRASFQNRPLEEITAKLYWLELTTLITREWSLFERLFHDKTEFTTNARVINERLDAHAKEADAADIALHRRALSQMEAQLSKIQ